MRSENAMNQFIILVFLFGKGIIILPELIAYYKPF